MLRKILKKLKNLGGNTQKNILTLEKNVPRVNVVKIRKKRVSMVDNSVKNTVTSAMLKQRLGGLETLNMSKRIRRNMMRGIAKVV